MCGINPLISSNFARQNSETIEQIALAPRCIFKTQSPRKLRGKMILPDFKAVINLRVTFNIFQHSRGAGRVGHRWMAAILASSRNFVQGPFRSCATRGMLPKLSIWVKKFQAFKSQTNWSLGPSVLKSKCNHRATFLKYPPPLTWPRQRRGRRRHRTYTGNLFTPSSGGDPRNGLSGQRNDSLIHFSLLGILDLDGAVLTAIAAQRRKI